MIEARAVAPFHASSSDLYMRKKKETEEAIRKFESLEKFQGPLLFILFSTYYSPSTLNFFGRRCGERANRYKELE
jgi:hypothetical protein